MDPRPAPAPADGTTAAVSTPLHGPWPRSAQLALGGLLVLGFFLLAGKSLLLSLIAGPSTVPSQRLELNSAGFAELRLLPGVGEHAAERIIQYRLDRGGFTSIDELRKVPGIGPATLERIRPLVFISREAAAKTADRSLPLEVEPSKRPGAKPRKAAALSAPIDINTATAAELMQLPGIGPKLSQRIVDVRGHKLFESVADLRRVPGIGPKTLEKVRPFVTVTVVAAQAP